MNIAFFYNSKVNPTAGGVERITYNLTTSFRRRGHNVINLFYKGDEDGIENFLIPTQDNKRNAAATIDNIVDHLGIDIIIDQQAQDSCLTHLCLKSKVKVIRCIHNNTESRFATKALLSNFNFFNLKESVYNVIFWMLTPVRKFRTDKALILRSIGIDKLVMLDEGIYLPKRIEKSIVTTIPNGIPNNNKNPYLIRHKKKQLLFVARLSHPTKNTRFVMQLWRRLSLEFPDWELIICGEGSDEIVMKDYARKHKIDRCVFKGLVDPEPYYKDASILLLPSFTEGFGMVLLEGMQYGCVPIVFDVCPAFHKICMDTNRLQTDSTPSQCGIVVKAMDSKAYISECRKLIKDADRRKQFATAAIAHVRDYDVEIIADRWEQLFEELTNQ